MRTALTLPLLGAQIFEGYIYDVSWNGWARPCFDFDHAHQIVTAFQQQGRPSRYDATRDVFVFADEVFDEEEFGAIEIEGNRFYPIGAGSWIWEEAQIQE